MRLSFLGATREVGRSAVLLDTDSERLLLDYGVKINVKPTEYPKEVKTKLDAILLSHSHLDHCGAIPMLYHQHQPCPVYALDITRPLSKMLLIDSYKISRHEEEPERYQKRDINIAVRHFKAVEYKKPFKIGRVRVTFLDAGHIPGSGMILLETGNKRILYTGDFRLSDTRLISGADKDIPEVDVLITESTYSDREHPDRLKEERKMVEAVEETLANNGVALISCFAIARTQEIILTLDEYELGCPIYLDGMGKKATNIINSYPELQREYNSVKKALVRLEVKSITNSAMRKKIIKKPCAIVTTSGMLTGGPVTHYIEKMFDREECTLILTGFQVPGTEGATLLETGRYIHEDLDLELKMSVRKFDFSSHASRTELFNFVKRTNPDKVFCVHGDNTQRFAQELREEHGFDALAPKDDKIYTVE
ncbi:MAG: MBL fold metallo-hydrolase [Candidatus Aenigmarchaeota archaeon]|nr:MBL fold metallo-hydrolase [Candidatus Aenigmarchaeota archaeon]